MTRSGELFSLRGRVGIVTGGSRGLGLGIARLLAELGATVHVVSRSGGAGEPRITHHRLDVTDGRAVQRWIGGFAEKGLDFLVNNAGVTTRSSFAKSTDEDWRRIFEVNVLAGARLARLAYPYLLKSKHGASVVFITSMAAHLGFSEVASYCASKAGVLGTMRSLAVEWAGDGIRVNSVAPGWFPSSMTAQVVDPVRKQKILSRMPMHRFGAAGELAPAVAFLLCSASSYITGHDLAVDGGALSYGY